MAVEAPGGDEADIDRARDHAADGDGGMADDHARARERRDEARRRKGRNRSSTRVAASWR